jgi:hypothetical protein
VGCCSGCCWRWWGQQSGSIEQQTCSNERICAWSRSAVCWAVDDFCASFMASLAVSGVSAGVWVLNEARVVVLEVVAAEVVAVVGSDMAVGTGSSGCARRGWGLGWSVVSRLGRVCRRFQGAGGSFGAGEEVLVVVVGGVVNIDGGCAGVDSGDVAGDSGGSRCGTGG